MSNGVNLRESALDLRRQLTEAQAELAAIKAQEPVSFAFRYDDGSWHDVSATQHSAGMVSLYAAPVSEAKAQGVVMPEPMKRGDEGGSGEYGAAMLRGYNACLREVARLNAAPAAQAADAGLVEALVLCVKSLDQLLPYLGKVPADIGLINNALMAARPALAAHRAQGVV